MPIELEKFTKEELIRWITQFRSFPHPREDELLLIRWELELIKYRDEQTKLEEFINGIDLANRDRLATEFNNTKNIEEKFSLLSQLEPYSKQIQEYLMRLDESRLHYQKIQEIYDSIGKARERESKPVGR